ncbi:MULTISPECIES: hypothetical protein [Serratia]|uniref:hypothetical protein n=1 Tax=Serratia TaxID=613 RepID=UPI001EF76E98|nr:MULTISPECIES: hypothetical protein [Serratia]
MASLGDSDQPTTPDDDKQPRAHFLNIHWSGLPGANWAWLLHRDSEHNPLARHFCQWLQSTLPADA